MICYNEFVFENIEFHGQFRTYQQKILDGADEYLKDGHIHIVAAPGSGKTVLGLELIRRLNVKCIIFSPTTTIRNQWGERFAEYFLGDSSAQDYISYEIAHLKPITSVTYQALHAAMKNMGEENVENGCVRGSIIEEVKRCGVGAVCLDEAHHLQNEWQKALENFLQAVKGQVKVIALTATPPYDASPNEWKRYINVCGEVDEEIFVPELVKQNTLCPHQDFIYFNYPTQEEAESFDAYRLRAYSAVQELVLSGILHEAYQYVLGHANDYDFLYSNTSDIVCLLSSCSYAGISVDKKLIGSITANKNLPKADMARFEQTVNFLIKDEILNEDGRVRCAEIFKRFGLTERGEVSLNLNEKLKRKLISSVGKLKSIACIVQSEYEDKGSNLRLLILTDYIKKESLSLIGTNTSPDSVSLVSVFEVVRRTGVCCGALSGSLVILPDSCVQVLRQRGMEVDADRLSGTGYSVCKFDGDNRLKVQIVSGLFDEGLINVLIGTKSLLGEGWDAPCVNSLILASFVGSFMLSNQMRGRAIRTDKNQPDKTANIWHLVTVERPYMFKEKTGEKLMSLAYEDKNSLPSYDFSIVSRRFECFVAPNYETGEVESGIDRVTIIKPPFNEKGIAAINEKMLGLSRDKGKIKEAWKNAVKGSARLNNVSEIPKEGKVPAFEFVNIGYAVLLACILSVFLSSFISSFTNAAILSSGNNIPIAIVSLVGCIVAIAYLRNLIFHKILCFLNPERSVRTLVKCVAEVMKDKGIISDDANVKVEAGEYGLYIKMELLNASVHDQNVFHAAVKQLLSPIENPRYIIVPRGIFGKLKYRYALACPDVLGAKGEYVQCLAKKLKLSMGKVEAVYTRTQDGRKLILECRKRSYITYNSGTLYGIKKRISHWE